MAVQAVEHLEAVEAGEGGVEDKRGRADGVGDGERLKAVVDFLDGVARLFEREARDHAIAHGLGIGRQQNLGHRRALLVKSIDTEPTTVNYPRTEYRFRPMGLSRAGSRCSASARGSVAPG